MFAESFGFGKNKYPKTFDLDHIFQMCWSRKQNTQQCHKLKHDKMYRVMLSFEGESHLWAFTLWVYAPWGPSLTVAYVCALSQGPVSGAQRKATWLGVTSERSVGTSCLTGPWPRGPRPLSGSCTAPWPTYRLSALWHACSSDALPLHLHTALLLFTRIICLTYCTCRNY